MSSTGPRNKTRPLNIALSLPRETSRPKSHRRDTSSFIPMPSNGVPPLKRAESWSDTKRLAIRLKKGWPLAPITSQPLQNPPSQLIPSSTGPVDNVMLQPESLNMKRKRSKRNAFEELRVLKRREERQRKKLRKAFNIENHWAKEIAGGVAMVNAGMNDHYKCQLVDQGLAWNDALIDGNELGYAIKKEEDEEDIEDSGGEGSELGDLSDHILGDDNDNDREDKAPKKSKNINYEVFNRHFVKK